MKTFLSAGLTALAAFLLGNQLRAADIEFQLPLSLADHTFSFWEYGIGGTRMLGADAVAMGYEEGPWDTEREADMSPRVLIPIRRQILVNGSLQPANYLTVVANRQSALGYFLQDDTAQKVAPPFTTSLVNAEWRQLGLTAPFLFFHFAEARLGHALAVHRENPLSLFPLTTGWVQGMIGEDGFFNSLGWFEAWTSGVDFGSAGVWSVIDLSTWERTVPDLGLVSASWVAIPAALDIPAVALELRFASQEIGRGFTLHIEPNGAEELALAQDSGVATASVGAGRQFRIVRNADGAATAFHRMPNGPLALDLSLEFPPMIDPDAGLTTLSFRISASLSPGTFEVFSTKRNAATALTITGPVEETLWAPDQLWQVVTYYHATARIDASQGYVVRRGGVDVGPGPDFFDWDSSDPSELSSYRLWVPASRAEHPLRSSEGFDGALTSTAPYHWAGVDAWTGQPYSDILREVSFLSDGAAQIHLVDLETGEVSPTSLAGSWWVWMYWHPKLPLVLKVSATRWQRQHEIRYADGTTAPLGHHRIQGDWSIDPTTGHGWFNQYGYFDASSEKMAGGIPWHLYDVTDPAAAVRLTANPADVTDFIAATDSSDADGDGLFDWEETLRGTNLNLADTDGDTVSDGAEVAGGTNPLAHSSTASNSTLKVFTRLE